MRNLRGRMSDRCHLPAVKAGPELSEKHGRESEYQTRGRAFLCANGILRSVRLQTARQLEEADRVNRLFMELDLKTEQ